MLKILRQAAVSAIMLLGAWQVRAVDIPSGDELPINPWGDTLSTNWLKLVREVIPAKYPERDHFDFRAATNALCQESDRGNPAAQGLWGFALIILNASPETSKAGLKLLCDSADKGYVPAMLNLGVIYESGKYVPVNYNEAFRRFSQAAELGDADAQYKLGVCHARGLGTTPDYSMAAKYYRLSAEQTNFEAMKSLGYLLANGYGVKKDEDEAKGWFLRSANGGNARAMYDLALIYAEKRSDTNAMAEAFKWTEKSAELGDARAADEMASFYFFGWGVTETNLASYRYWRFKGAFEGSTDAQFYLGQSYRIGDGVPKDPDNSLNWYRKAAAKNHPRALFDLALDYQKNKTNPASLQMANGLMTRAAQMGHREAQFQCAAGCFRGDFNMDYDWGRDWLEKAAENGWPKAEFLLFELYYNGVSPGTNCPPYPKDKTEAVKWLRRAAEHGYFQAQSTLGVMMIRGQDVDRDREQAEKLLRDAAEHGYAPAQNDLGYSILSGGISSADPTEAAMWCMLAVANAADHSLSIRAKANVSNALNRLTPDQVTEAEKRVKNFQPQPAPNLDPMVNGWEKNPEYQAEDGQFTR